MSQSGTTKRDDASPVLLVVAFRSETYPLWDVPHREESCSAFPVGMVGLPSAYEGR